MISKQMPFSLLARQGCVSYSAAYEPVQIGPMWRPLHWPLCELRNILSSYGQSCIFPYR